MDNEIKEIEQTPARSDLLEAGELVACRYRVERCGRNHPLGELYRVHDETADRPVLLQRLRREFASPDVRDRLFETRGSAALEVEAIADILDYGEDLDGRPFLVTEWCDDASLVDVERPLSFREAVAIVERVAAALEPVHRGGLVHGGIEPNSVLVDDERELTGLLDFGLVPALEAGADKVRALQLMVSPAYAAPELIRGQPISPAADVYALGILLWELIFGSVPYRGATLRVLDSHLNRALPEIELPFDAPASFEWILRRMLAKQPADRFADAGEVVAQLRPYASLDYAVVMADDVHDQLAEHTEHAKHAKHAEHAEHDDAATIVFERERQRKIDEDSWLVLPATGQGRPVAAAAESGFAPLPTRRRRAPRRVAALAGLACALLVSWWGFGPGDPASESPLDSPTSQALRSVDEPALVVGTAQSSAGSPAPGADPQLEIGEPDSTLSARLSTAKLRSRKNELYRRVERRCVDGRMRRTIKLAVRVAPAGSVEAVSVIGGMASTKIGRCVRNQARKLEFPATEEGGFYTYTLRLR